MVGGTYHDHEDVEKLLGVTLASSGEWPTDTHVDNMTKQTEGEATAAMLPWKLAAAAAYNPDALDPTPCQSLLCKWTLYNLFVADKWRRARGAQTTATGQITFSDLSLTPPEVLALQLQKLAEGYPKWGTAPMIRDDSAD